MIAGSNSVLSAALPHVSPAESLSALKSKVKVTSVTDSIISISASGGNAGEAEATANAVAKSYVSYITAPDNPVGKRASVLEAATSATGTKLPEQLPCSSCLARSLARSWASSSRSRSAVVSAAGRSVMRSRIPSESPSSSPFLPLVGPTRRRGRGCSRSTRWGRYTPGR